MAKVYTPNDPKDTYQGFKVKANDWQLPFDSPTRIPTLHNDGTMLDPFKLDVTSERPDSPWLNQQMGLEDARYQSAREQAAMDNQNQVQSGWNSLATNGGLDSGARERLQQSGIAALSNANTGLAGQHSNNVLGLRSDDFTNQVNADKYNIQNNLNELAHQSAWDLDIFGTGAEAYAAAQMAGNVGTGGSSGGNYGNQIQQKVGQAQDGIGMNPAARTNGNDIGGQAEDSTIDQWSRYTSLPKLPKVNTPSWARLP